MEAFKGMNGADGKDDMNYKRAVISEGRASLGIELGSTRIKAVLIGENHEPLASGNYDWENRLEGGYWTYSLDDVRAGLRQSYAELARDVSERYGAGVALKTVRGFGISAMMHGYLAFDAAGTLLVPFRTWRNTTTEKAAAELTSLLGFNIPLRWSAAHLYQAVLNGEEHLRGISHVTTLAGYVHWLLTGRRVIGVGDASGMFPIDSATNDYNAKMADQFDALIQKRGYVFKLRELFPKVLAAGEDAGMLTAEGAKLLDPDGILAAGIAMCPPEGDAGTGMVATNSVAPKTGNISAGTSVFAMAVLENDLTKVYPEIDIVTTPDGKPVAMVHCNNCTSDLDEWVRLFGEANALFGSGVKKSALYDALYEKALEGDPDCGGLLSYNYVSGETMTGFDTGRPLFTRTQDSRFTLANFMRALLFSTMASIRIGMDILVGKENVQLAQLTGHGGLFKTKLVGQRLMAAALSVPIAVMESAGEGGAWGMAILAAYRAAKASSPTSASLADSASGTLADSAYGTLADSASMSLADSAYGTLADSASMSLADYLSKKVFAGNAGTCIAPDAADAKGFDAFMKRYVAGLPIEKAATQCIE